MYNQLRSMANRSMNNQTTGRTETKKSVIERLSVMAMLISLCKSKSYLPSKDFFIAESQSVNNWLDVKEKLNLPYDLDSYVEALKHAQERIEYVKDQIESYTHTVHQSDLERLKDVFKEGFETKPLSDIVEESYHSPFEVTAYLVFEKLKQLKGSLTILQIEPEDLYFDPTVDFHGNFYKVFGTVFSQLDKALSELIESLSDESIQTLRKNISELF